MEMELVVQVSPVDTVALVALASLFLFLAHRLLTLAGVAGAALAVEAAAAPEAAVRAEQATLTVDGGVVLAMAPRVARTPVGAAVAAEPTRLGTRAAALASSFFAIHRRGQSRCRRG